MKISAQSLVSEFKRVIDDDKGLTRFINLYHDRIYYNDVYLNDDFLRLYQADRKLFDDTAKTLSDIAKAHPDWRTLPYFIKQPFQEQVDQSAAFMRLWVYQHRDDIQFKEAD